MDKFNAFLEYLMTTVRALTDAGMAEAPLVVQQYLVWEAWSSWSWMMGMLTAAVLLIVFGAVVVLMKQGDDCIAGAGIVVCGAFLGVAGVGTNYMAYKKVQIAPKVVVMEKVQEMLQSGNCGK